MVSYGEGRIEPREQAATMMGFSKQIEERLKGRQPSAGPLQGRQRAAPVRRLSETERDAALLLLVRQTSPAAPEVLEPAPSRAGARRRVPPWMQGREEQVPTVINNYHHGNVWNLGQHAVAYDEHRDGSGTWQ